MMCYLGNKTKLLTFIEKVIDKYKIEGETFADLFAGTGSIEITLKGNIRFIQMTICIFLK